MALHAAASNEAKDNHAQEIAWKQFLRESSGGHAGLRQDRILAQRNYTPVSVFVKGYFGRGRPIALPLLGLFR